MPHKNKEQADIYFKEYYDKYREKKKEQANLYYLNNKEKVLARSKIRHLLKTYGLSVEAYNNLLKKQNYSCAICKQKETAKTKQGIIKPLSVDHCHTTGKIRKLLCNNCNCILGYSKDNPEILTNCISYLKEFS